MNYPHIVSAIDLLIDRLEQARALLLESGRLPTAAQLLEQEQDLGSKDVLSLEDDPRTASDGKAGPEVATGFDHSSATHRVPQGVAPALSAIIARHVAPRLQITRRRARAHVPEPTALGGARPAAPVFIPAAAKTSAATAAPVVAQRETDTSSPREDGTLESLLRHSGQSRSSFASNPVLLARDFFGV